MKNPFDESFWLEKVDALVAEAGDMRPLYPRPEAAPTLRLGGKRVRARLLLRTAHVLGSLDEAAVILAAAIEMVHNASLFHDDVIDQAQKRRGGPALHTEAGSRQAVMTGDVCFAKGMELICRVNIEPVYHAVSRAVVDLASGQLAEAAHWGDRSLTLDRYFFIVDRKTGALLSLCLELPGILAGPSDEKLSHLGHAGRLLGRLFQVADDMLDLAESSDQTGKDPFRDLAQGRLTFPYLLLLREGTEADQQTLLDALGNGDSAREQIRELVRANGLQAKVEKYLADMLAEVREILVATLGEAPAADLLEYCESLAYRKK